MKIFALLFCLLFFFSCQKTEPTPENEKVVEEVEENVQELLVFDDIVGKFDELNHGEKDIFFLYLNMIEDQAFQISLPLAEDLLRKDIEKEKQKKEEEKKTQTSEESENKEEISSESEIKDVSNEDISEEVQENKNDISDSQTEDEEDSDEPDLFWIHMYAKQLVRDNWGTIFGNIRS